MVRTGSRWRARGTSIWRRWIWPPFAGWRAPDSAWPITTNAVPRARKLLPEASASGRDLVAGQWPIGRLSSAIEVEEAGPIRIDSLLAGEGSGGGTLRISGLKISTPAPLPELLKSVREKEPLLLRRTGLAGHISIDDLSVGRIVKTGLQTVRRSAPALLVEPADPMTKRIRTVREGQEALGTSVASSVAGAVRVEIDLSGSAAAPRGSASGSIRGLRVYQARAGSSFSPSVTPRRRSPGQLAMARGEQDRPRSGNDALGLEPRTGGDTRPIGSSPGARRGAARHRLGDLEPSLPRHPRSRWDTLGHDLSPRHPTASVAGRFAPHSRWGNPNPQAGGKASLARCGLRARLERRQIESPSRGRSGEDGQVEGSGWWRDLAHFGLDAEIQKRRFSSGLYHVTADAGRRIPVDSPEGPIP
jgi:hypothetical protein